MAPTNMQTWGISTRWGAQPGTRVKWNSKLTCGTKSVPIGKLPHASQELHKASDTQRHTNDGVRVSDTSRLSVEEGKNERRGRERVQTAVK